MTVKEKDLALWAEIRERGDRGDRLTLALTPREAYALDLLIRLGLRDELMGVDATGREFGKALRVRIGDWLSETPLAAEFMAECQEWERKYEENYIWRMPSGKPKL